MTGKHHRSSKPLIPKWLWLVIIIVGVALLLGWNPLGLDAWEWEW